MKLIGRLFFLALLLPSGLWAAADGNRSSREIADVVFRDLDSKLDLHSAIYVGNTCKTCGNPVSPYYHQVIEMTGMLANATNWRGIIQEGKVKGIGFVNLAVFEHRNAYYGAFMHQDNPDVETRREILRKAQFLMRRDDQIIYIVQPGQSALSLLTKYFTYGDYNTGPVTDDNIKRMRSDAFVEYCYASAGVPIMPYDITTESGASSLMYLADMGMLPSNQQNNMVAAQSQNPTLTVKERSTGNEVADIARETTLDFDLQDSQSGPGLLALHKEPYESGTASDSSFPIRLLENNSILTGNITPAKTFNLSAGDGLEPGYYQAAAYDHAGNSSFNFNFKIPPLSAININSASPLYNNFRGVSATAPSTLERSHTFDFSEPVAGVSAVSIDGPQGNLWTQTFDPPVPSTSTSLSDLPVGDYTVKSFNSVGEETKTPFKISDLNVSVSLLESTQNYIDGDLLNSGTFYIKAHIVAESLAELNRIQVLTSTGAFLSTWALLAERVVSGHSASGDFDLPAFPISCPPGLPWSQDHPCVTDPRSYLARVIDSEGNIKAVTFTLTNKHGLSYEPPPALLGNGSYAYSYGTDTTKSDYIPAPVVRNYDIIESTSGRYRDTGTGYGIAPSLVSGYVPQHSTSPDITRPQTIGTLQQIVRTWSNGDKSDVSETVVSEVEVFFDTFETHEYPTNIYCNNLMGLSLCGRQTINTPVLQSAKRYVEWETVYNKTSDATTPVCRRISYDDYLDFECARFGARIVSWGSVGVKLSGFTLSQAPTPPAQVALIPIGKNIFAPLNSYGEAYFDEVTSPGYLSVTATHSRPPAGFSEAAQNTAYEITPSPELAFTGNVKLTLKYPSGNLTSAQESQMKLVKVINPATGKYNELVATLDPVKKTISVTVTSFSKFMALAPEYPTPYAAQSSISINGSPEMEFMSGAVAFLPQYDMGGVAGAGTLAALKSANKLPIGNVYSLSTDTDTFKPSGAIKMRYSGGVVAGLGVDEDFLAIYGFTESGDLYKLPYQTLDKDNKVLTARVPSAAYPLFAVLASSQQVENIPPSVYHDGISPETSLSYSGVTAPAPDGTYISGTTAILFSASDPQVSGVLTSGVNLTNYILYPDSATVAISTYTGPFTLPEGAYPLYYLSVDNAGNYEFPKATTIYVDVTPPETALSISELNLEPGASFYAAISGTVTLIANDPLINSARSGVYKTLYLVDKNFSECQSLIQFLVNPSGQQPNYTGQPGTCENPLYTAPFILFPGTHTVQFLSIDNIRNMESLKTFYLDVQGDIIPPETFLLINGSTIASGGSVEITTEDQITLTAADPESDGTSSGVKAIYYLIDVTMASCLGEPDLAGPVGTCRNPLYAGPFTLAVGTHTIYYTAEDDAGNLAAIRSAYMMVQSPLKPPMGYSFARKLGDTLNTYFEYLDLDSSGNIYVSTPSLVLKLDAAGKLISTIGRFGTGPGQFRSTKGVAVSPGGDLFVADSSNVDRGLKLPTFPRFTRPT